MNIRKMLYLALIPVVSSCSNADVDRVAAACAAAMKSMHGEVARYGDGMIDEDLRDLEQKGEKACGCLALRVPELNIDQVNAVVSHFANIEKRRSPTAFIAPRGSPLSDPDRSGIYKALVECEI